MAQGGAWMEGEPPGPCVRRIEGRRAQLASGEWVEFDPAALASGADDALYARVRGERARLTRAAQLSLAAQLREKGGRFFLELEGRHFPIGRDAGPEPVGKKK